MGLFDTKPLVANDDDDAREQFARLAEIVLAAAATDSRVTPDHARSLAVLVHQAGAFVAPPAIRLDAAAETPSAGCGALDGVRLVGARVAWPGGPVRLRRDQILAARLWGTGLRFPDERGRAQAATLLLHAAAGALREAVEGAQQIERRHGRLLVCDDPFARAFERLMLDLLNEERHVAFRATLADDLLKKTDLRLRLPGVDRAARVQVSTIIDRRLHERKIAAIPRAEELVIVTPRTLAVALDGHGALDLLPSAEILALRRRCDGIGHDRIERLAIALRGFFQRAVARPTGHPLGPLVLVPDSIRRFVRAFAAREARSADDARRARIERTFGRRQAA